MKRTGFMIGILTVCAMASVSLVRADDVIPRIDQRFASSESEQPDFRRHVVPLLGKLGCNGRACHGSFQGQGGFRLSLFGYDFKMDREGLAGGDTPRVDVENPDESLALQKATSDDIHEGGQRFAPGSWEHHVLRAWIRHGAKGHEEGRFELAGLHVTPSEIPFSSTGQTQQLRVVAEWSDGLQEDVTPLCRFQSNSDQVATISEDGLVTATDAGDTHVVVYFDTGVVPIPVVRPVSELAGDRYPDVPTPTEIDRLVVNKLRKLGIVPSELSSDAEFLRRLRLDLTGTLPTASEVEAFLNDTAPNKRARKIDELLDTPAYAAWWTTRLCDITGNNDTQLNNVLATNDRNKVSQGWYDWIYRRVAANEPYSEIAMGIILGRSREGDETFEQFCSAMSEICRGDSQVGLDDRETMPFFWARNDLRRDADARSIAVAYSFMGIRIQCAQCHKHPFDQWTQVDFKEFTKFFSTVTFNRNPESRDEYNQMIKDLGLDGLRGGEQRRAMAKLLKDGKTVPFSEVFASRLKANQGRNRRNQSPTSDDAMARVLGGEAIDLSQYDDPRQAFAEWLVRKDNPYFARSFVNRVWANYFNVGIVEPPDDMSLANPPSNRALLDYLTAGFVERDYDMRWLHREITNSRTYQLSWKPTETNRNDLVNFSHAIPRRLPAEVAYDAVRQATLAEREAVELNATCDDRAIGLPGVVTRANNGQGYALQVFGRSTRETNCDCDRSSDSSLLQTVYLQNDEDVLAMIESRNGWLREVAQTYKLPVGNGAARANPAAERRLEQLRTAVAQMERRLKKARRENNERLVANMTRQLNAARKRLAQFDSSAGTASDQTASPGNTADFDFEAVVQQAYLRTLSRYPTDEEVARARDYLADPDVSPLAGVRDLMWALVNTKEFIVNH